MLMLPTSATTINEFDGHLLFHHFCGYHSRALSFGERGRLFNALDPDEGRCAARVSAKSFLAKTTATGSHRFPVCTDLRWCRPVRGTDIDRQRRAASVRRAGDDGPAPFLRCRCSPATSSHDDSLGTSQSRSGSLDSSRGYGCGERCNGRTDGGRRRGAAGDTSGLRSFGCSRPAPLVSHQRHAGGGLQRPPCIARCLCAVAGDAARSWSAFREAV